MSPFLAPVFTVVFTVTGVRSLIRLLVRTPGGDRTAELSHLLMSIAMVGMAWGWSTGPDTTVGAVQVAVFGVLAVVFGVRVLDPAETSPAGAHHLLVLGAMVWMALSSHGSHDQHAAPVTQLVTVALVVLLCATAVAVVSRRVPVPAAASRRVASATRAGMPLDRAGHVLMSGGMAAMLLAML